MIKDSNKKFWSEFGLWFAAASFGSTFFMTKFSLADVDPITLVTYRFLISTIILGGVLIFQRKKLFANYAMGLVLGVLFWLLYDLQTIGLKYTSAANSGFITGTFVIFVPIFGFLLFKTHPTLNKIVAIFIAFFGLWLLTGGLREFNIGDMLTVIVAALYALHILYADKYAKRDTKPEVLAFQQFFFVTLLSFITGIFQGASFQFHSSTTLLIILYLGLIPTLTALTIQLLAQKHTAPIKVALIFASEPLFAALFTWTFGREPFIFIKAIGGLFVVFAIVISEFPMRGWRNLHP